MIDYRFINGQDITYCVNKKDLSVAHYLRLMLAI